MQCIATLLWCIFMVLIIVDNWSDASIDNLMASKHANKNVVQNMNAAEPSENCNRPCKFGIKPRRCIFNFDIAAGVAEDGSPTLLVNQQSPGPPILVCLHDVVHVVVTNSLPGQELSLHWHGMRQQGSPFMDGVPMITQCPTIAGTAYRYTFRASEVGTHFYHAHSANQQAAGVVGALVVRQPAPLEPNQELYSHDRGEEHSLLVTALGPPSKPNALRINGRDDFRVFVAKGLRYRMRMTNAVAAECPLYASVARHPLAVIAADGNALKPTLTKKIVLFPGERVDFVLSAKQEASGYWLRIVGGGHCQGLEARTLVVYSGFNYTSLAPFEDEQETDSLPSPVTDIDTNSRLSQRDLVLTQTLHAFNSPHADTILTQTVDKQVFLSVDRNTVDIEDSEIEFRYLNDAMPIPPFYPTQMTMTTKVTQINRKNFLYPSSPLLTQPRDVKPYIFCEVGAEAENKNPECLQTITAQLNTVLELVIVNEGFGGNDSYTFHLHGNPMYVLISSDWSREEGISVEDFKTWDAAGGIKRNLIDPPVKDTVTVPNKGFIVVRVYLDNPGTWLLECRSCALASLPVAVLIKTPIQMAETIKDYLPKCGNYKGPDVLLN